MTAPSAAARASTGPAVAAPDAGQPPVLRVADAGSTTEHEHVWQLGSVDFDEGRVIRQYDCQACTAVWYS